MSRILQIASKGRSRWSAALTIWSIKFSWIYYPFWEYRIDLLGLLTREFIWIRCRHQFPLLGTKNNCLSSSNAEHLQLINRSVLAQNFKCSRSDIEYFSNVIFLLAQTIHISFNRRAGSFNNGHRSDIHTLYPTMYGPALSKILKTWQNFIGDVKNQWVHFWPELLLTIYNLHEQIKFFRRT